MILPLTLVANGLLTPVWVTPGDLGEATGEDAVLGGEPAHYQGCDTVE